MSPWGRLPSGWPVAAFGAVSHARIAASASGSSSSAVRSSARSSLTRLRLVVVTIDGFAAAGAGLLGWSSLAGSGSRRLLALMITAGLASASFRFLVAGL